MVLHSLSYEGQTCVRCIYMQGEGVVQSVGVVLSHDQDGSDSVDFRPLSVCSDEVCTH